MSRSLLEGKRVRLTAEDPKQLSGFYARCSRDSEYLRLMDSGVSRPWSRKEVERFLESLLDKDNARNFLFNIRTLADNRLVGDIGLDGVHWTHGDAFMGIAIGDRRDWDKGFGTDALQVILRYAFCELNLRRVTLNVFEYNPRAVRVYEKAGFHHEGRVRKALLRDGQRWDIFYMSILQDEWLAHNDIETGVYDEAYTGN